MNERNGSKVLVRSRNDRMVAGVCAGVADYFGVDATLVRVMLAVVSVLTAGVGLMAYLAAWILIPEEGEKASIAQNIFSKQNV